jgi:hypothetical protein
VIEELGDGYDVTIVLPSVLLANNQGVKHGSVPVPGILKGTNWGEVCIDGLHNTTEDVGDHSLLVAANSTGREVLEIPLDAGNEPAGAIGDAFSLANKASNMVGVHLLVCPFSLVKPV